MKIRPNINSTHSTLIASLIVVMIVICVVSFGLVVSKSSSYRQESLINLRDSVVILISKQPVKVGFSGVARSNLMTPNMLLTKIESYLELQNMIFEVQDDYLVVSFKGFDIASQCSLKYFVDDESTFNLMLQNLDDC